MGSARKPILNTVWSRIAAIGLHVKKVWRDRNDRRENLVCRVGAQSRKRRRIEASEDIHGLTRIN